MGLVDDHEVPLSFRGGLETTLIPGEEIDGRNEDAFVVAGELARLGVEGRTIDEPRIESELLLELLFLPLLRQATWCDDEYLLEYSTEEQFLDQEPGHDRLARPRVVGEQESDSRQRKEIPIDGLDLVRKRIDDAGVDRKEGVELVSDADALGLGAEEEKPGIAVERMLLSSNLDERGEFLCSQRTLHQPAGLEPNPFDQRLAAEGGDALDLNEFGRLQTGDHITGSEAVIFTHCRSRHFDVILSWATISSFHSGRRRTK
jgi:hypothetical protein